MVILVFFNSFNVVKNLKKPDPVERQKPPLYTTHIPRCMMSFHKAIMVITGRSHYFFDFMCIYYACLASARFEYFACRGSLTAGYITLLA